MNGLRLALTDLLLVFWNLIFFYFFNLVVDQDILMLFSTFFLDKMKI